MTKTFLPGDVLTPAKVPTMYFIGVTTANRVFGRFSLCGLTY